MVLIKPFFARMILMRKHYTQMVLTVSHVSFSIKFYEKTFLPPLLLYLSLSLSLSKIHLPRLLFFFFFQKKHTNMQFLKLKHTLHIYIHTEIKTHS